MGRTELYNGALLTPPLSDEHLPATDAPSSARADAVYLERKMGDTELSYFLPSRQSGVNDMYLHLGFNAPEHLVSRARVRAAWALLRLRHPLLAAAAQMHDYDDVRFVYRVPVDADDVLQSADANLEYRTQAKDELIDAYLNGPRTLSNDRLSYLVVSRPEVDALLTPPRTPSPSGEGQLRLALDDVAGLPHSQFDLLICAMHFIGDGMALHTFANDFFGLLGSSKTDAELDEMLRTEWSERWQNKDNDSSILPAAMEDNIPIKWSKLHAAAASIDFQMSQQKLVGGQAFPRRKHAERRTVVPTLSFPEDRTKAMLTRCKAHGVSISAALFAVCNAAWARLAVDGGHELPTLMYSALNLRPYFTVRRPAPWDSYWFLSIGYFNVILPTFVPADRARAEATFWHRARQAKEQSARAARHPLLPVLPARATAPSAALLGLSLLGNLDGMYKHAAFPAVRLHTLTTGSRQRHGAMLLFGYTFVGKLWVSLGYDENGFAEGVVDRFWTEALKVIDEFLG
ncbi:hypothetical protein PHLGIDRAFT_130931 [Phlebiopsis gigantea 11061_1 CR5-6]|uniref:Condensation domain-containing protein n=1 Tax=Phlebiopsis gigantea (strain 11061_1 CR5-6) TaxID=745531 RepID=A0A0C3NC55_PHLG1|nr:hypothetical protein PHLGIDRAFT_130931 [Phlebiopsis gigantea 11061_1 CR5-6]